MNTFGNRSMGKGNKVAWQVSTKTANICRKRHPKVGIAYVPYVESPDRTVRSDFHLKLRNSCFCACVVKICLNKSLNRLSYHQKYFTPCRKSCMVAEHDGDGSDWNHAYIAANDMQWQDDLHCMQCTTNHSLRFSTGSEFSRTMEIRSPVSGSGCRCTIHDQGRRLRGDRGIVPLKKLGGGDGSAFIPPTI